MLTPQENYPELAKKIGFLGNLYLKREDLHPYESHKGRSIPLMIENYLQKNEKTFVISSSGNAALAAIHTIKKYNLENNNELKLKIYIGPHISRIKIELLNKASQGQNRIEILQVDNPKQQAFLEQKNGLARLIRQSTDDLALAGYAELAEELNQIPNLSAIFIPTSSGTTAQGLGLAFEKLNQDPEIHLVQTPNCHPFVEGTPKENKKSLADAIVDQVAHRKKSVLEIMQKSRGQAWIINDQEIIEAINDAKKTIGLEFSPNSALSLAGFKKYLSTKKSISGNVVCLITGR